jgi:hypothetical protein
MLEQALEHLKNDEFREAMMLLLGNPDQFSSEDRKKIAKYCLSSMPEMAEEVFTLCKVKSDTEMMKQAFQHVKLSNNNTLIYAIELGLDAVAERLALEGKVNNLDAAIYKCLLAQNGSLAGKLLDIKAKRQAEKSCDKK